MLHQQKYTILADGCILNDSTVFVAYKDCTTCLGIGYTKVQFGETVQCETCDTRFWCHSERSKYYEFKLRLIKILLKTFESVMKRDLNLSDLVMERHNIMCNRASSYLEDLKRRNIL